MPWITKEGRSVDEARQAAIAGSGLPESELDIEVVNEGAKGLFGLGGEPAVVRVRPKSEATDVREAFRTVGAPPRSTGAGAEADTLADYADEEGDDVLTRGEIAAAGEIGEEDDEDGLSASEQQEQAAELGTELVRGILERMDLEGEINTRIAGGTVYIEVFGEEMGILIGRSGATLEALQELVRAGIQRKLKSRQAVVVDVEGYWDRRRKPQQQERRSGGGGGQGRGRGRRGGNRGRGRRGGGGGNRRDGGPREVDGNRRDSAPSDPD